MKAETESTILIIDDHPLLRKGVAQLVDMDPDFRLVGEAQNGTEGIELAAKLQPDIILLDLNMKGMNGIQTLKQLKQEGSDALIIVLTVCDNERELISALHIGADGYLLKDMEPEQLLSKLRNATRGQIVLDEALTGLLANSLREKHRRPFYPSSENALSPREEQILSLIASGMSNKLIASKLQISDGTVKVHVKNLLRKLNLRSRLEAAVWALNENFKH